MSSYYMKDVKPNRAAITRTVMPAQPEPLHYKALSYAETVVAGVLVGLAIAFVVAVISVATGCAIFEQPAQDMANSTTASSLSQTSIDDDLAKFRRQSKHASETLVAMRAYAEGGVQ